MPRFLPTPSGVLSKFLPAVSIGLAGLALSPAPPGIGSAVSAATQSATEKIHPVLREQLASLTPGEQASAIFMLTDQAELGPLEHTLKAERAPRARRHQMIVSTLQQTAAETQSSFLAAVERLQDDGSVVGYTPYWISNLVIVAGSRSAMEALAQRPEIAAVEPNFVPILIAPVASPGPASAQERGDGVPPGLRAIRADAVWHELGVTGEGSIVACLDTGVDATHPALFENWRGNHVDPGQCWLNVDAPDRHFPRDYQGHGTHVMGTMSGIDPATGDTVGVAWGAQWIGTNGLSGANQSFDNNVIKSYQWFADPDGDPETLDDVPDVVQNSWGAGHGGGYEICDTRWYSVIDNCEAAGVVVTWSAGNDGPLPRTVLSPQNRAETPYRNFAVGAVSATHDVWPYPIAGFSSRGPSTCPPGTAIKPEIVAPGVNVYSTYTIPRYNVLSGTSMAGPHVAGVVALMRQVNPELGVDDVKRLLMETARAYGPENNTFGMGLVDAYDAVLGAAAAAGRTLVAAEVRDAQGDPVVGARIAFLETGDELHTRGDGEARGFVPAGVHTIEAGHRLLETRVLTGIILEPGIPGEFEVTLEDRSGPYLSDLRIGDAIASIDDSIRIMAGFEDHAGVQSAQLHFRHTGHGWQSLAMAPSGQGRYAGEFTPYRFGQEIEIYITARDVLGQERGHPDAGSDDPIVFSLQRSLLYDDAETDQGWVLAAPGDAAHGAWARLDPHGTDYHGTPVEPADDHSPEGTQCFVTGEGKPNVEVELSDVDGGCVTLTSPPLDLSEMEDATLVYWRWFALESVTREGSFRVEVGDAESGTWTRLEELQESANNWTERSFPLHELIPLGAKVRIRFVACDTGDDSLVEAAVDDISIRGNPTQAWIDASSREPRGDRIGLSAVTNPGRGALTFRFNLPFDQEVAVDIFDPTGRRVKQLRPGLLPDGPNTLHWNGEIETGGPASPGIYLYRFSSASGTRQGKIALLR
ncbi:MAG: S8 family serine peptidase [Candidatus Eisenbacteria bacterium]|nr:S8 family serine peptidase [Candidatus Eisenbacteria bacterium]